MRDFDREQPGGRKDEAQAGAPLKVKARDGADAAHGHTPSHETEPHAAAHSEILRDERLAHPANAEPLADLLGQLQHSHGNRYVQRVVSEMGGAKAATEPGTREAEARPREAETRPPAGAHGLDAGVRSQMETAFGEDFGDVRLHTGSDAERMNEEMGARAVTRGRDIYFGKGEYDSSTREGKQLLAHELTHVVQQRGGSAHSQDLSVGQAGDSFEREADEVAASVVAGQRLRVKSQAAAPAFQRQGQQTPTAPPERNFRRYPGVILPEAREVTLAVDGWFTIHYIYNDLPAAAFVTLTIRVPEGMTVTTMRLTSIDDADYHESNVAGSGARTISIGVNRNYVVPPLVEVDLTLGNHTYIAVFQFPTGPSRPAATQGTPTQTPPQGGRH